MFEPVILAQILWTGVANSSYIVLLTVAFALTLKVLKLFNFAQAAVMATAFYAMFFAYGTLHLPPWLGIAFGLLAAGVVTAAVEIYGFRVLRRRRSSSLTVFIFTLVISELLAHVFALCFGTEPSTLFPSIVSPVRLIGGLAISDWDLGAVATTAVLLIFLVSFVRFTKSGQALIAVADNAELAELYGIDVKRSYMLTLLVACLFVVAGMYLYGTRSGVIPETSLDLLLSAVIATILGGIGNVYRAAGAAVFVALVQSFSILFIASRWQGVLTFAVLFVTILLFPEGLKLPKMRFFRLTPSVRPSMNAIASPAAAPSNEP